MSQRASGISRFPLFFLVSGFLFFQKYDGSWATYKEKLSRRVKTLLIPFLIWNFATYLVYFAGESIPATKVYFATKYWPPIRSFTALDYANAFFGFTVKFPMSYQFWFIRDLMVMVVLSPLIYLLLKRRAVAITLPDHHARLVDDGVLAPGCSRI